MAADLHNIGPETGDLLTVPRRQGTHLHNTSRRARARDLKQELYKEGSRCSLLSRQHRFNERRCIRCSSPFTFLVNLKRQCLDCQYNVCNTCSSYSKKDKAWGHGPLDSEDVVTHTQHRHTLYTLLLKTQSLEWYYNNVKCRFKKFVSAKVMKTIYRKHLAEHGTLGELTEGSTYEESIGNEGSVFSDKAFCRQSEEHSMAETFTVALRVAGEAIYKAEGHTDNQDMQSEARYLRDLREELIEELATTIAQKIIRRRKNLVEMKPDYDLDWPPNNQSGDQPLASSCPSSQITTSARAKASLWDSQQGLKEEGGAAGLASWKSVDHLDDSSKSLLATAIYYSHTSLQIVLEWEFGVISAYNEMGSDDAEGGEGAWGAALLEISRKMTSNANNNQGSEAPDTQASAGQQPSIPSHSLGHHASTDTLNFESEVGEGQVECQGSKLQKPHLAFLKRERDQEEERLWQMEVEIAGGRAEESKKEKRTKGTELTSTEDELDRVGRWEEEWEEERKEESRREGGRRGRGEELTIKLHMLASQFTQLSSTEDELDRVGLSNEEMEEKRERESEGEKEELTSKLCRLARQRINWIECVERGRRREGGERRRRREGGDRRRRREGGDRCGGERGERRRRRKGRRGGERGRKEEERREERKERRREREEGRGRRTREEREEEKRRRREGEEGGERGRRREGGKDEEERREMEERRREGREERRRERGEREREREERDRRRGERERRRWGEKREGEGRETGEREERGREKEGGGRREGGDRRRRREGGDREEERGRRETEEERGRRETEEERGRRETEEERGRREGGGGGGEEERER
ncbi:unnamed protein product [Coregonus sp. 'balchen']|nr:unnamed protein product [Coregonus sp. 'balchen']